MSGEHWRGPFQRAKVIKVNNCPWLLGRELWVRVGRPERHKLRDIERKRPVSTDPTYVSNLYDHDGVPVHIGADQLELLARDERDFSEEVECEFWKTWRDRE